MPETETKPRPVLPGEATELLSRGLKQCAVCGKVYPVCGFSTTHDKAGYSKACKVCSGELKVIEFEQSYSTESRLIACENWIKEAEMWRLLVHKQLTRDAPSWFDKGLAFVRAASEKCNIAFQFIRKNGK